MGSKRVVEVQQNVYPFEKGYATLKRNMNRDLMMAKAELMAVFGICNEVSWIDRMRGRCELTINQRDAVNNVFKKYKVKKKDVWGFAETEVNNEVNNN